MYLVRIPYWVITVRLLIESLSKGVNFVPRRLKKTLPDLSFMKVETPDTSETTLIATSWFRRYHLMYLITRTDTRSY